MAIVVITIEDIVGGANDGATDFQYRLEPSIEVDAVTGDPTKPLTLAQRQGFALVGFMQSQFDSHLELRTDYVEEVDPS